MSLHISSTLYGPFLLKLPYYHQKVELVLDILFLQILYFFYMIMDRCIDLNQDHFVTKLNNGFLISGRTFYPLLPLPWKNVTADLKCTTN